MKVFNRTLKIVFVACAACMMSLNAIAQSAAENITIQIRNKPFIQILSEIEAQSGCSFTYDSSKIDTDKTASLSVSNKGLREVLDVLCKTQNLKFEIVGKQIVLNAATQETQAQQRAVEKVNIQGRVFEDREPPVVLAGCVVSVQGTGNAVITDQNGYFNITANRGDVLVFSFFGHQSQTYTANRNVSDITISLREEYSVIDQIVVTGMTEERKINTVSSISSLNLSSNLENKPILSLSQALQGGITGIAVTQSTGLPGADAAAIKIRGISTLNNSDPLVLVDGIPMDMNNLDPTTIESVTVLKDAAAAAIYGSRAANGVIVIKTKRGTAGKVRVSYNGYYGVQQATYLPDFVSAPTYMDMVNKAYANIGGDPIYTKEMIDKTAAGTDPMKYPNTDWRKLIMQNGGIQSHSLAVSGGSALARFALTANYQKQSGLMNKTEFDRWNIRANTSVSLSDNLSINMDFNSYRRKRFENMYRSDEYVGKILQLMYTTPPNIVGKYPIKEERPDIVFYGNRPEMRNPLAMVERGGRMEQLEDNVSINIRPQWNIAKNLTLKGQYSYNISSAAKNERRRSYNFFDYDTGAMIYTWGAINRVTKDRSSYNYLGGTLEYLTELNKHRIFAIAGYNQELWNQGDFDQIALRSYFGKVNYSFDNRYLAEIVVRGDGSSRFGPGRKYGYFPSAAVGWRVSEEKFMESLRGTINNFKVRASYGLLGNQNIGLYKYQSLVSSTNGTEVEYGNPDITWESVDMLNIGADLTLFKDLTITFDYYDKMTRDMIIEPPLSQIGGIGLVSVNSGTVRNRGWEIDANYYKRVNPNWAFNIHLGLSQNKNKIVALLGAPYDEGSTIQAVGHAVNSHYVYETHGLLQVDDFTGKDANGKWIPKPGVVIFDGQGPGDIHYVNQNNDDIITTTDRVIKGSGEPKLNYFGNFSVEYKKVNLEVLFQGVQDVEAYYNGVYSEGLSIEGEGLTPLKAQTDYWTSENTDARYPRLAPTSQYGNNHHVSTFWRFDASYLRVKYIQLGYTFDQKELQKIGLGSIYVYANAQNPFTIARDKLVDPEGRGTMWDYPMIKTWSMGVNINF